MADQTQAVVETERVENLACIECLHVMDVSHLPSFSPIQCPACGVQQTVPAKFGAFLLLSRLGSGGMGVIYHAVDSELGRHVALKVMKRSLGDNPEFVSSFKHEAQAAATLNHRNVVQIYSFGQVAGQPYIAMELVDGGRLDEMIAGGPLAETRALEIHLEVTEGLNAASQLGLVHGDIKPANILFGSGGEAKVVDFGLASFIGQQQQQGNQVWGTPYYIAPEKARGKKADFRSDIYSLGATLFHVLIGQPPFDGPTPVDVVMARLKQPAPNVLDRRGDLRPQTAAMVARMLETDPAMRYPSYPALLVDMRAALEACRALQTKAAPCSAVYPMAGTSAFAMLRKWPWKIILAAALVLAGLGAAGLWGIREHERRIKEAQAMEEQVARQLVLDRGRIIETRAGDIAKSIADTAASLPVLEQQARRLIPIVPESAAPIMAVRDAVDRGQDILNIAEDTRYQAAGIYHSLTAAADSRSAQALADRLERLARSLEENNAALNKIKSSAAAQLAAAAAMFDLAIEANEELRRQAAAAAAREKALEAERARALQEKLEAERLRPTIVQRELDLLDEARAANAPRVQGRRFGEAGRAIAGLQPSLTQPESKAYFQVMLEAYRCMDAMKEFLVNSIRAEPCPRGWLDTNSTERDIVKADPDQGLTVALGPYGAMQVAWDKIGVPQVLKIAERCLNTAKKSEKERAEVLLGLALFCYESGEFKLAEKCLAEAAKRDPAVKARARSMMPGF